MKPKPPPPTQPTELEIRQLAHELYVRSGYLSGRDLDNWLEAEACLTAQAAGAVQSLRRARSHARRRITAHP